MIASNYDLQSPRRLQSAILELRGYWKLWSACLLQSVGLPAPRGIIFTRYYESLGQDLENFLNSMGVNKGLVRHDRQNETPPYPRGGFLASDPDLPTVIQRFFSQGRIVAVYEPLDRLQNGYNVNVLFRSGREALIEVVGPGFDASNLQRGDVTPHEVFSLELSPNGDINGLSIVHRTSNREYRDSVTVRLEKFQQLASDWPTLANDKALCSKLAGIDHYRPIPASFLEDTVSLIVGSGFVDRFLEMTGVGFPLNVSASYVDSGKRQIFWDATAPSLKFQGLNGSPKREPAVRV